MASRRLEDLRPEFRTRVEQWRAQCEHASLDILIYCTLRSTQEQADLYALGRTKAGSIVTNAKPGQSAHNYGLALDFVPMIAGRPQWSNKGLYKRAIDLAEGCGLHSLRNSTFPELAHLEMPDWKAHVATH